MTPIATELGRFLTSSGIDHWSTRVVEYCDNPDPKAKTARSIIYKGPIGFLVVGYITPNGSPLCGCEDMDETYQFFLDFEEARTFARSFVGKENQ